MSTTGILPDLIWDNPERPAPGTGWQGIDHVSLNTSPPPGSDFVASLTLSLFDVLNVTDYDVTVTGPQTLAFQLVAGGATPQLHFAELGGRGTYFVKLTAISPFAVPVHPFFALASFAFTIDCETADCQPTATTAAAARVEQPAPVVDLQTKDFDGFLQLLAARVRVQNQDWADLSSASLEAVLVEMLAHQGDMLSYYQDRIGNEAFLDTASQRFSLRQHGLLLGYQLFDGAAATTVLSFTAAQALVVPSGFAVRMPSRVDEAPVIFSVIADTPIDPARNAANLQPAQWPQAFSAQVPQGATSMLLLGHLDPVIDAGTIIALVLPGTTTQIRTLTRVELTSEPGWVADPNVPLGADPADITRIHWDVPLDFPLRVWDATLGASPLEIHANLVNAQHGAWRLARLVRDATTRDDTQPDIQLTPQSAVATLSPLAVPPFDAPVPGQLRELRLLEGPVLFDRVEGTLVPAVQVTVNDQPWTRQDNLLLSQPFDHHFTTNADNDGRMWLGFGDGRRGQAIDLDLDLDNGIESARLHGEDASLRVRYRIGQPAAGNVDIGKITEIVPGQTIEGANTADITGVTNIQPATGGQTPETLDHARLAIPASLRHGDIQRAVTLDDYATLAQLADPRVARATARSLGGPFGTVLVLVDPEGEAALDDDLRGVVQQFLEQGRMVGREVLVRGADSVPLDVSLAICPQPGFDLAAVKEAVLAALRPGTADHPGFFHPDRLTFGQDVALGDVLAAVQAVPGVLAAKALVFCRLRSLVSEVLPRIVLGITEVARNDADDTDPDNGRLVVLVAGLDDFDITLFNVAQTDEARGART
jgi:hypothetical protein